MTEKVLFVQTLYKHITRPSDYLERFDQILHHLEAVYDAPNIDARMRRLCENIAIEYLTKAILKAGREHVRDKYLTSTGGSSLLSSARVSSVWHFSSLENELSDAADRVSESLFDEANDVLCWDLDLGKLASFPTNETCTAENVTCPAGLHRAKMLLAKQYAIAYAKTQTFCRQALTSESYTPFDTDDQCMRYMRQYMPLHMPQIEEAVKRSLLSHDFGGSRHIRILDVGAGPGTLYCVLAAMFGRGENVLSNYTFEYCPLEPSSVFADFFRIVGQNVKQKYVEIGRLYKCNLGEIDVKELQNFDWIFVGNAVTAMVASSSAEAHVAMRNVAMTIRNAFDRSRADRPLLTIAENSGTNKFDQFCKMLADLGLHMVRNKADIECDGSWISQCKFLVTRKISHHPKLFLSTYTH
jgi:hypothetical protein